MSTIGNILVASPSAPDLIQDLLVANGEGLPVQAICRAGELIGIGQSAIRVALNRLTSQGKITHSTRGFYAMHLSGPALSRAVDDWRHKELQIVPWDGSWVGVQDSCVLRSDKTGWRRNRLALSLRGFRSFQPGLHLRPHNLAGGTASVRKQLQELGLAPQALVFRLDDVDEAREAQARALWDVKALSREYQRMRQALKLSAKKFGRADLEIAVRESLLLGRAVVSQLIRDPLLPSEMAAPNARQSLTDEMKVYQRKARALWHAWLTLP